MRSPRHEKKSQQTEVPFTTGWQRLRQRIDAFRVRTLWWRTLDRWENSRSFRWLTGALIVGVLLAGALLFWVYPWWTKRNSVKMARQWLAAGRINYAVEAVQQAMQLDPQNPEPWQIAAEIARRRGQKEAAADYAHHAANLAPGNSALLIAWSAEALRADLAAESTQALSQVSEPDREKSPDVQRLLGELARREERLDEAKSHFEKAILLDGPVAIDEVPLGVVLLNARDSAERQRGLRLLEKWAADHEWGAVVLRTLLSDARAHNDLAAMAKWAEALRANVSFTNGDMPDYLAALAKADPSRFAGVLATLEKDHSTSPESAVRLLSWLNQIGRSDEALRWSKTLPGDALRKPPLALAIAEAQLKTADWMALQSWVQGENWGAEGEFLRWAYGMQSARKLGNDAQATDFWKTLYSHAQLNGVHALFAGSTLYSWGNDSDAEALWWRAAEQEGSTAIEALGSLARYYQVHRDAEGQYRVFRRLHVLRPNDASVGNNFSFFASLTGREQRLAEQIARENFKNQPAYPIYVATLAFNLFMQGRAAESLTLLAPLASKNDQSPAFSLVHGLALAGTGKKAEARVLLEKIPANTLTSREVEVIESALRN